MPWPAFDEYSKKRYLKNNIWGAVLSIVFYLLAFVIGYILWQSKIWNQGASRIIGLWSVLCGLFTLLTLRKGQKKNPVDLIERGVKIGKDKIVRTVILALTVVFAAFLIVFISDYLFLTDYRLWCFATIRAFSAQNLPYILLFVPFWLFYYIITSVAGNCFNYVEMGEKPWASAGWQAFFVFLGPQLMIMIQYIKFFITGKMVLDPITGIMGIWLFPIVLILPLASVISHLIYRKTKNPYIGGIIMGIIACILTVSNTLTG